VAILLAYVTRQTMPADVVMGYVNVQLDTAVALANSLAAKDWAFDWLAYGLAVWPYASAGGALVGAVAWLGIHSVGCFTRSEERKSELKPVDLGTLAAMDETPVAWALPRVIGRKVITLVSAPPGAGKGWWLQGFARAMDDASDFYGLPVTAMKLLWCTEEGESVTATARRFGIKPGRVQILRRDQVQGWSDWPELVRAIRKEAWRRKCQIVIFDTVRAWCPQAERTPELANEVMHVARRELTEPGLAAVFVHHDRKGGGEHGEGVSGTNGLVGAVDILVELKRVQGRNDARQMLVSRRFGDMDATATLRGHQYVADRQHSAPEATDQLVSTDDGPTLPSHLRRTLTTLKDAGEPRTIEELLAVEGGTAAPLTARLKALEALGLVSHTGKGVKNDPVRWAAVPNGTAWVSVPSWRVFSAVPNGTAVRDNPEYMAYLKSPEWAAKRTAALASNGGRCQRCPSPAVVAHHLTYERAGHELPDDLVALCAPCHRRAHAA
jgi:hypothetical protein